MIVVHRKVLCATIIPKCKRAGMPHETARELRFNLMPEKIIEEASAFLFGPIPEVRGVADVHVERLAPGLRMRADDWMLAYQRFVLHSGGTQRVLARLRSVCLERAVDSNHALERALETRGERLVSQVLVRENGVPAIGRDLSLIHI